ncbi:ecdysteroid 22-kinase family protein [Photobacterium sp. ZSDE20]|uniref:Ecdysteroid 22-kinase family protein n=1 Tax=Photobacterium pectinilyticum TaxID=2906793 RepID=A0ABT1NAT0_9GAMM|nr:ecdysteroid 22-kinase family protein [Photobacterium sp. ZSDE20]MCQ1060944.1 ecdysteroid 22-kinase family protein [Photobacterium sp. ZSDE20]MDD1828835.1 ecdysteroid 22-kinase family protein [Photobacterium sp. ZSDE20]
MNIPECIFEKVVRTIGVERVKNVEHIQSLWSGYGELVRLHVDGGNTSSVIVKYIVLPAINPDSQLHPRGWNTSRSHQRKLDSYLVEVNWYREYANLCQAPVPKCLMVEQKENEILLVLEDLATMGYNEVHKHVESPAVLACLRWLAQFHAQFMSCRQAIKPQGLWPTGTYWHLATRPDELAVLEDLPLKAAAGKIDTTLACCKYQTLVHGDAKLANFCFTPESNDPASVISVAAVDFQYVGGGCGMKDVCLLLSSVLDFNESESQIQAYLDEYFATLKQFLFEYHPNIDGDDVEQQWRPLYSVAWADFQRFVKGWCPDHWKINPYTEQLTDTALRWLAKE